MGSLTGHALLAAALLGLAACGDPGGRDAAADGAVVVTQVWARTTPPGTTVGAVYLTAASETGDRLIGADVDPSVAASATLHSTETTGSMATMTEQTSFEVPADDVLVLGPSGSHVMLVDLAGPLERGATFDLTLQFEAAGDETVSVEVRDDAP